tara:strand:+ start:217 stop:822 length:606 start_codon:yes stop_codon:yes gene_type:complete
LKKTIDSIVNNLSGQVDYFIQISLDEDDPTLAEYFNLISPTHEKIIGTSKNKIDAINRDMDLVEQWWDILVNVSDDQVFIKQDFDLDILEAFVQNTDLFVHFPDGNQGDLATMSIIGREYYKRDNYIYNPEYMSVYCDNEAQDVAKLRDCYKLVNTHIFNHEHPAFKKGQYDSQYAKNEHPTLYYLDHQTYLKRALKNFYL